jgi:hypothetical protein
VAGATTIDSDSPRTTRPHWVVWVGWTCWIGVLVAATWSDEPALPGSGFDPSWELALHVLAHQGTAWGSDVAYSLGPLGFVSLPPALSRIDLLLLFGFTALANGLLLALVCFVVRKGAGNTAAALIASALVALAIGSPQPEWLVLSVGLLGILCLSRTTTDHLRQWLPAAQAALAVVALLIKPGPGIAALGLTALTIAATAPRWRAAVRAGTTAVVTFVLLWSLLGQSLLDVPRWFRLSVALLAGYGELATEPSARGAAVEYALALGLIVALVVVVRKGAEPGRLTRPKMAAVIGALLVWYFARWGFTRHDQHAAGFFAAVAVVVVGIPWRRSALRAALGLLVAALVGVLFVQRHDIVATVNPLDNVSHATRALRELVEPGRLDDDLAADKQQLRDEFQIPASVLAELQGERVTADTWALTAAWAYDLRWQPIPVLQTNVAYDPQLDALDADFLNGSHAPDRVLRRREDATDDHDKLFESPSYSVALFCNYEPLAAAGIWQVDGRVPNRCGHRQSLGSVQAQPGETIAVPAGTVGAVVAHVHLPSNLPRSAVAALFKPFGEVDITLDSTRFRLVERDAAGPLIVRVPGSDLDFLDPAKSPNATTMSVSGVDGTVTIEFEEIPTTGN